MRYSDSFRVRDAVYLDVERIQRVIDYAVHRETLAAAGRFKKNYRSMETDGLAQLEPAHCSRCNHQCPNWGGKSKGLLSTPIRRLRLLRSVLDSNRRSSR